MEHMDQEWNLWVVGGDLRQRALARLLREDGHTVHIAGLECEGLATEPLGPGLALAHCVILPLPVTRAEGILHTPLNRGPVALSDLLDRLDRLDQSDLSDRSDLLDRSDLSDLLDLL